MNFIKFIKAQGYRVFVPKEKVFQSYCFYTDGVRIAYAQWPDFKPSVSSVHKENKQTGDGYFVANTITTATLAQALDLRYPAWDGVNHDYVQKYKDWDEFHNETPFNRDLVEA